MPKIPNGAIAAILNRSERRVDRHTHSDDIPYVHVSTLINTSLYGTFCPREFALRYFERTPVSGNTVPPKFRVMWQAGHAIGEHVVNDFLRRSAEYAQYAWGDWECKCGKTRVILDYKPNAECPHCHTSVDLYKESDIRDEVIRTVGHADLLLRDEDGLIYVYEVKSIDRADVNFDTLEAPLGDHVLQASFYYWLLIAAGYKVYPYVRVIYVDRSLSDIYRAHPYKEFEAKRVSKARIKLMANKAKTAKVACETGVLPPRICKDITESRAKQCKCAVSCFARVSKTAKRVEDSNAPTQRQKVRRLRPRD